MGKKAKLYSSSTGYDLAAATYDQKLGYLDSFEKNQLFPLLGDLKNKKVLDVGSGTGRLTTKLAEAGASVIALDVSEKILEVLKRKNKKIETVVASAEALPFSEEKFDLIIAAFLIVHLKDPIYFFEEAWRTLKPGGQLVITNINQKKPPLVKTAAGEIIIESYYHRPEAIKELLENLSFEIKKELLIKEGENWINQIIVAEK